MQLSALLDPKQEYDERELPLGAQEPTHHLKPPAEFTHGHDALELAAYAGYELYPFQCDGVIEKLGFNVIERRDGALVERWAAQETCDILSRRNGKSVEIEVLILAGLFLLGEMQIMYTAHRDDTAKAVFDKVVAAIKRTPKLWSELIDKGPRVANGQRAIILKNGATCYFRTRTKDAARGQGFDRLIIDEAQELDDEELASVLPLVSGNPNGQINYAGSAGGMRATVQAKLWRSFLEGQRGLLYRGWHAERDANFDDLDLVARTNPRLGRGLSYDFIAKEFSKMTRANFGRERVGVPTFPRQAGDAWVIPEPAWLKAKDEESAAAPNARLRFVLEADPELEYGTIAVAGRRVDKAMHIEVTDHEAGTAWMVDRAKSLQDNNSGEIWLDPKGPCGFMIGDLQQAGVAVRLFEAEDVKNAWKWLYTNANPKPDPTDPDRQVPAPGVYHRGGELMNRALGAAELRPLLDNYTLRRSVASEINQGPIFAPMLAAYAVVKGDREKPAPPPARRAGDRPGERTRPERLRRTREVDVAKAGF